MTYLDELDDLGEGVRISLQLLPDRPLLSSLAAILELMNDLLSGRP
jgi:hypothetical protein